MRCEEHLLGDFVRPTCACLGGFFDERVDLIARQHFVGITLDGHVGVTLTVRTNEGQWIHDDVGVHRPWPPSSELTPLFVPLSTPMSWAFHDLYAAAAAA